MAYWLYVVEFNVSLTCNSEAGKFQCYMP